ncbi:hypothetical protein [uncultured Rhodoferax sp.]|uniref:hypothetical protein n=1 Tax=uncultured Rhodoferax sp. TaxID=223188 RepID=UPI0026008B3E|nr:hypothetical protein [uncultured Rhodoferax sp.]
MFSSLWCARVRAYRTLAIPLLAGASALAAHAQAPGSLRLDPGPTLQASQASSPVPAALYRSVFADLPQGVEDTVLDWKAANAAVGQFPRGHADLLKWEQEQARKAAPPANRRTQP